MKKNEKNDLNNKMHSKEAMNKFINALNIDGLIFGRYLSTKGNTIE